MNFERFAHEAPSPQAVVDIFKGRWASDLGRVLPGIESGGSNLFGPEDSRPRIAADRLGHAGSLAGMRVLELGPLEGGHTWQLEQLGANSLLAVEANAEAYLKCLIVKELLGMKASFLFGDVAEYLRAHDEADRAKFDLIFCSGVLYHMIDPLRLIELIARCTDRCFVWTHYYHDGLSGRTPEIRTHAGFEATHWLVDYGETRDEAGFWGGNQSRAAWLERDAILAAFRHFGLDQIDIAFDVAESPGGPSFAFVARRSQPQWRPWSFLRRPEVAAALAPVLTAPARDRWLLLFLALLLQAPALLHLIDSDPLLRLSVLAQGGHHALLPGLPGWIDPNIGFTTQALGHLAAQSWLRGVVPWWNAYTGVGVPLAAEMQPAALFLPFILLLHFADGLVWLRVAMQAVSGLATYELLRSLGLRRGACLVGGVLYACNGTLAWLPHGPERAAAFLPMILLGIERAAARAAAARPLGWLPLAMGLAWSLYAGFPETAFLDGLLAGAWALLRLAQGACWPQRARLLGKLVAGTVVGLSISAPVVSPFLQYLALSDVGGHAGAFAHAALTPVAFPMFLLPYVYGPISSFGYDGPGSATWVAWGTIGGYVGAAAAFLAAIGLLTKREAALRWLLAGWIAVCIGKTANAYGVTTLFNQIPFIQQAAFFRYAEPSWSLATIVLAAFAVDHWLRHGAMPLRAGVGAALGAVLLAVAIALAWPSVSQMLPLPRYPVFATLAVGWAVLYLAVVPLLLSGSPSRARAVALFALVCLDAVAMYAAPQLSAGRGARVDLTPIRFLQAHLGLQRFYSLDAIPPNYGALFGIASINDNMLPVPAAWSRQVSTVLAPGTDPTVFLGSPDNVAPQRDSRNLLAQRLGSYRDLAVRYIVTRRGADSLRETIGSAPPDPAMTAVQLASGGQAAGRLPPGFAEGRTVAALGVNIGTYDGKADGALALTLCSPRACSSGEQSVRGAPDNASLEVPLFPPLETRPGDALRFGLRYVRGSYPVALWLARASTAVLDKPPAGETAGYGPDLTISYPRPGLDLPLVFTGRTTEIYELPDPAPYFSTDPVCKLDVTGRLDLVATCPEASFLTRRELDFPGWRVSVDDRPARLGESGIFQTVALPPGRTKVAFRYAPPHARASYAVAAAGVVWAVLAVCAARSGVVLWRRRGRPA